MPINSMPDFLENVKKANLENRDEFATLFSAGMDMLDVSIDHISYVFGVPYGTISRWKKGITAPSLLERKYMINYLCDIMEKMMSNLAADIANQQDWHKGKEIRDNHPKITQD